MVKHTLSKAESSVALLMMLLMLHIMTDVLTSPFQISQVTTTAKKQPAMLLNALSFLFALTRPNYCHKHECGFQIEMQKIQLSLQHWETPKYHNSTGAF